MNPRVSTSSRQVWIDYSKGVAILLVVFFHSGNGILTSRLAPAPSWWNACNDIAYVFMVPLFFFVSGWLAQKSSRPLPERLIQIGTALLYPYVLWVVIQGTIIAASGGANTQMSFGDIPKSLLAGPIQFWFLRVLLFCLSVDLLFRAASLGRGIRGVIFAAAFLVALGAPGLTFPGCYVFFEAGCVAGSFSLPAMSRFGRLAAGTAAAASTVALCLAGFGYLSLFRPATALLGIAACLLLCSLPRDSKGMMWLRTLGRFSLQIYCAHLIFSAGSRMLFARVMHCGFYDYLVIGFASGVFGPLFLAMADEKWLGWAFRVPLRSRGQKVPAPNLLAIG